MRAVILLFVISIGSLLANEICNMSKQERNKFSKTEQKNMQMICIYKNAYNDALSQVGRDMLEQRDSHLRFNKWIISVNAKHMTSQEILSAISWGYKVGKTPILAKGDVLVLASFTRKANAIAFQERAINKYFKYFQFQPEYKNNKSNTVYEPASRVLQHVVDKIKKKAMQEAEMSIFVPEAELPFEVQQKINKLEEFEKKIYKLESKLNKTKKLFITKKNEMRYLKDSINKYKNKSVSFEKKYRLLEENYLTLLKISSTRKVIEKPQPIPEELVTRKSEMIAKLNQKKQDVSPVIPTTIKTFPVLTRGDIEAYAYSGKISKGNILKENMFDNTIYLDGNRVTIDGFYTSTASEVYGRIKGKNLFVNKADLVID
jgi:hypothetical protein